MKKLTVLVNNSYYGLLIANTAINLCDAYTVMVGLEPIPLIKLLENSEVNLIINPVSKYPWRLRYGETGLYIKVCEWTPLHLYLSIYHGINTNIISEDELYSKYIEQSY